ncbi:MAG TPA: hypothetical protein VFF50_00565 [Candidatus Deferrimicrobiaceae bacterium]|jgi:hypothetical protein|nr:hypothetical protein [Candidatus Deferrimicrobiaceae bacterium]
MPPITNVMPTKMTGTIVWPRAAILLAVFAFCGFASAQQVSMALLKPASLGEPFSTSTTTTPHPAIVPETSGHRFWDRENSFLFATNAAFSAADFVVTRDNLRNGGQELNPVTRVFAGSTAGLAMNFAGETAGVVGLSYFFHKTGHHRLERAVSMLNIGSSASAVAFGLAHR